jgi:hypothetical protein
MSLSGFKTAVETGNLRDAEQIIQEYSWDHPDDEPLANQNFPRSTLTPLVAAIYTNNVPMAKLLLQNGADVMKTSNELEPWVIACNKGATEMCSLLRKYYNKSGATMIYKNKPPRILQNLFQASHDFPGQLPDSAGGRSRRKRRRRRRCCSRKSRRRYSSKKRT